MPLNNNVYHKVTNRNMSFQLKKNEKLQKDESYSAILYFNPATLQNERILLTKSTESEEIQKVEITLKNEYQEKITINRENNTEYIFT